MKGGQLSGSIHRLSRVSFQEEGGSGLFGACCNFINCVIGAGIIGTGGAIAQSGYAISMVMLLLCALLTKFSLDLLIELGEKHGASNYEELGHLAYGMGGKKAVIVFKFLYSFGCCIAYIVVLKKNMNIAIADLAGIDIDCEGTGAFCSPVLLDETLFTLLLATVVILPLCLQRKLDTLAKFSFISIVSVLAIVCIVIYEFTDVRKQGEGFDKDYLDVRPGFISSMGTFVFAFVSQHTSHVVYRSMKNRSLERWKTVSTVSITVAGLMTSMVGSFSYFTFWLDTSSDLFTIYPASKVVDSAELLLSITMLFTYPMPFFTTRELILEWLVMGNVGNVATVGGGDVEEDAGTDDGIEEKLLPVNESIESKLEFYMVPASLEDGNTYQLKRRYHVIMTLVIWGTTLFIALAADSLGSVLDLVGCISGSAIAFIIPALINIKLENRCGFIITTMLCVSCFILVIGSAFSLLNLVK